MHEQAQSRTAALGRKALAALILLVAAWVLLHFIIHIAVAIASVVVVVLAVVALIWAARVLF
ncbi:MAG: hypothetical protein NVSMB51_02420 [Solirubrobacteraceae bacterium]